MAKANSKTKNTKQVNDNFDRVLGVLDDMVAKSEEIMPLFADSLGLSKKIVLMYKKAFNLGIRDA